ncbi:MAG: FAD-binding oxidoreductase [Steroidobacteraceae bacterium]
MTSATKPQGPSVRDVTDLAAITGADGVLAGKDMQSYVTGIRYGQGKALCVVRPATGEQVSRIVALCVERHIGIVPQGANTGLVGASVPDASGRQVLLSLERLRGGFELDLPNRSVTVDAGMRLQELNARLESHGLWFPIDLGADPSIGGMIATNAGGTRLIRYGDVRHNLMAVEVVLFNPPGQRVRLGSPLRKDNTGWDLKQLFIGASGTTGIITRATLEVHPRPRQSATALVVPASEAAVNGLLAALEADFGDYLAAFEGMSGAAMHAAIDHIPNVRNPFAPDPAPEFAVLIELEAGSPRYTGFDLQDVLDRFLADQYEATVSNAVVGGRADLWHLRHGITEGARNLGRIVAFDISVARSRIMEFRRAARALVEREFPHLTIIDFGHIADGGLHFNLVWPRESPAEYSAEAVRKLRMAIYALVVEQFGGSFSAEHGIGPHNVAVYEKYTSDTARWMAHGIKQLLDPLALCGAVDFGAHAARSEP